MGRDLIPFVLDRGTVWPAEKREAYQAVIAIEKGIETPELIAKVKRNVQALRDFLHWLENGRTRAVFTTPEDLKTKLVLALNRWLALHCYKSASRPQVLHPMPQLTSAGFVTIHLQSTFGVSA